MAATAFGALSAAQKKAWAVEVSIAGRDTNFWMSNGFMGKNTADMSRPVQRITDLTPTERGDLCIMQLVAELQGDGTVGDNQLEGNEESLINDEVEIRIDQLRHGVRSAGKMAEQRTVLRFRSLARDKLGFWLGDTIDELLFLTVAGRPYTFKSDGSVRVASELPSIAFAQDVAAATDKRVIYAGAATSEASLTASDTMTWNLIVNLCAFAKRKRIKPIRQGGKPYLAMVLSTEQLRDLKTDPNYQQLVAKAGQRGPNNPLFNNAVAVIDGTIIYEHPKVFNTLGAASGSKWGAGGTIDGAQATLMGAQALGFATLGNADWQESDNTDYKNRPGIGYGRIIGMVKPRFKSIYDDMTKQDFGVISLKTAAAPTLQ